MVRTPTHLSLLTSQAAAITPISIVLNSPHLVDEIMRHATRPTLAVCLRVNEHFYAAAGKVLYHTVRVDGSNMESFFGGALVETGRSEDIGCEHENVLVASKTEPKSSPPHRNFKAPLLAHTRVLSLGSHFSLVCGKYGPHIGGLLRNLDTLRIVPRPGAFAPKLWLDDLCDEKSECLVFRSLTPRKIVIRNAEEKGWYDPGLAGRFWAEWKNEFLEEVVWVMPSSGKRYTSRLVPKVEGEAEDGPYSNEGLARVKIIFHDEWESWTTSPVQKNKKTKKNKKVTIGLGLHSPDNIIDAVGDRCWKSAIRNTVYGLESLHFKPGLDWVVYHFQKFFPHETPTSDRLRQLVRDELRSGALRALFKTHRFEDNDKPEYIEYKTLEEYAALPERERMYELDDGLE